MNRGDILNTAKSCVCGGRSTDYGTPEDNFGTIAKLWSIYKGHEYSSLDVAVMMSLLKVARIKSSPTNGDSYVDLAGYAACAGEIAGMMLADEKKKVKSDEQNPVP